MNSNSQASQDVFAAHINQYSTNGYFLDLGCNEPVKYNNTALLEQMGWSGILVDYDPNLVNLCSQKRASPAICADLTKENICDILNQNNAPNIIDYISLDLDHGASLTCLESFNFKSYKVRCITFEHDAYTGDEHMRTKSREIFKHNGLKLICKDVKVLDNKEFEDWYIDPTMVDESVYSPIICEGKHHQEIQQLIINLKK
jgi:hypothetical protein